MSEVQRFPARMFTPETPCVHASDFDRVTAERDALQERLNAADQGNDDLSFQLKDREGSRRDWFEEAQRLQAELAERDALLRETSKAILRHQAEQPMSHRLAAMLTKARAKIDRYLKAAALSASAEPSDYLKSCEAAHRALSLEPSAPVERDERAEFERAFVVQEGVYFSADRNEYRSMNGRSIEYTDAEDLNLRLQGWQARAALDKATEGASHE